MVVCQVGVWRQGRLAMCAGWLGAVVVAARERGRDCMVSLTYEGWVPHDHRFVAGSQS